MMIDAHQDDTGNLECEVHIEYVDNQDQEQFDKYPCLGFRVRKITGIVEVYSLQGTQRYRLRRLRSFKVRAVLVA